MSGGQFDLISFAHLRVGPVWGLGTCRQANETKTIARTPSSTVPRPLFSTYLSDVLPGLMKMLWLAASALSAHVHCSCACLPAPAPTEQYLLYVDAGWCETADRSHEHQQMHTGDVG